MDSKSNDWCDKKRFGMQGDREKGDTMMEAEIGGQPQAKVSQGSPAVIRS